MNSLLPSHRYHVKHKRKGQILSEGVYANVLTEEGMDAISRRAFNQDPALNWYMGLGNEPFSPTTTDTAASHSGWTENEDYVSATRPEWIADTYEVKPALGDEIEATGPSIIFQMNASSNVRGMFLISNETKGGSTGKLLSIVDFGIATAVAIGDEIEVTFTFGFSF